MGLVVIISGHVTSIKVIPKSIIEHKKIYLQKLEKFNNSLTKFNGGISHRIFYCIIGKASLNKKGMSFLPPEWTYRETSSYYY